MIKVNVLTEGKTWSKKLKKRIFFLTTFVNFFQKNFNLNKKILITLLLSNNENIKKLNKKFRNINKHTDILSFPFHQKSKAIKEIYLGDIIISINYINRPKNLSVYEFKEKLIKIFIHGFLHLLNFDHTREKDYLKMLKEEQKIFESVHKFIKKN